MFKFFMKLSILLLFLSCDGAAVKKSDTSAVDESASKEEQQQTLASYTYSALELDKNNKPLVFLPLWKSGKNRAFQYSYQPKVNGLKIDPASGSLSFASLADFAQAGGQAVTVTAIDNQKNSYETTVKLKIVAQDKEDLLRLLRSFSQNIGLSGNYNAIDTSRVSDMSFLFDASKDNFFENFNGDISAWDTSKVENMEAMFRKTAVFNGSLAQWDTSQVTNMRAMFANAAAFNGDISSWDTSQVRDMEAMFSNASVFNQNIGSWNTAKVSNMSSMFANAASFNQDIGRWKTVKVTNMSYMFLYAMSFDQDISAWKTLNVANMRQMFYAAFEFNQDIQNWDVLKAQNQMNSMFSNAVKFNKHNSGGKTTEPKTYFHVLQAKETKV